MKIVNFNPDLTLYGKCEIEDRNIDYIKPNIIKKEKEKEVMRLFTCRYQKRSNSHDFFFLIFEYLIKLLSKLNNLCAINVAN